MSAFRVTEITARLRMEKAGNIRSGVSQQHILCQDIPQPPLPAG